MDKKETIWTIITCALIIIFFALLISSKVSLKENNVVCDGLCYISFAEKICYTLHNPNSIQNYSESWGTAYRSCLLQTFKINDDECSLECKQRMFNRLVAYNLTEQYSLLKPEVNNCKEVSGNSSQS